MRQRTHKAAREQQLLKNTGLVKHCTGHMAFLHYHYETSTLAEGHEWEHTGSLLVTQAVPCKIEHVSCPALEDSCFFFLYRMAFPPTSPHAVEQSLRHRYMSLEPVLPGLRNISY